MSHFTAGQLQVWTGGKWRCGVPRGNIRSFSNDTRRLAAGACFVALRTEKRDGHDFLAEAARAGAAAALVERRVFGAPLPQLVVGTGNDGNGSDNDSGDGGNDAGCGNGNGGGSEGAGPVLAALQRIAAAHRLRLRGTVFGVTGSAGKTSTKDLLAAMLGADGFATQGNLNNFLGLPLSLLQCSPARHRAGAVIEAGMSVPGEMETLARTLRPDVAIVTNVLPAHLEGVGTLEGIAREKVALIRHIRPGGIAVFPATLLRHACFRDTPARLLPVQFPGDDNDAGADDIPSAATPGTRIVRAEFSRNAHGDARTGTLIRLSLPATDATDADATFEFQMPECPDGMLRNAALAATAALAAGIAAARVRAALAAWTPSPRRGEILRRDGRLFYVDCYNANPASMLDAAHAFDRLTRAAAARVFVLGGMNELGPESTALHRQTGTALPLRPGDALVLFGGDAPALGEGARSAGFSAAAIHAAPDIESVRALVAAAALAPVFLKGSRSRALERVLE